MSDLVPEKKGIDRQMLYIRDRARMHEMIDDMGDDGIAILAIRSRTESDSQLQLHSYGEGQQTEFVGLLGYLTIMMHREYFTDDE
jgi:hypothetical protein